MRSPAPHHPLGGLLPQPGPGFALRKREILAQLARPDAEYTDASPKGSVDAGIRDLLDDINGLDGFVTTSSCAGRASVFVEGCKQQQPAAAAAAAASPDASGDDDDDGDGLDGSRSAAAPQPEGDEGEEDDDGNVTMGGTAPATATVAGVGGKGGGGTWLYVSHDPFPEVYKAATAPGESEKLLGLVSDNDGPAATPGEGSPATPSRLIHFKFEPMILHVLTASPEHAQLLLKCGLQAGFRESGAINLTLPARGNSSGSGEEAATPLVAIRSMGLGLESLVGARTGAAVESTVSSAYLRTLMGISNERFAENTKRIQRFRAALAEAAAPARKRDGTEWEDAEARRQRKKAEGLRRKAELQSQPRDTELDEALDLSLNADMS